MKALRMIPKPSEDADIVTMLASSNSKFFVLSLAIGIPEIDAPCGQNNSRSLHCFDALTSEWELLDEALETSQLSPGVVLSYGPCSYLFSFAAHHPKRLGPLQAKSIYVFDIGRREWLQDPVEGLGDVLPESWRWHGVEAFLFQMHGNKLASVWCYPYYAPGGFGCEVHWSKFNLRCVQDYNSSHPRFHADLLSDGYSDVQGNYISNCTAMVTEPRGGEKSLEILEEEMGEESYSENYPASPSSSSSPQPAQPSTGQPISSVLQSSHDIGSKTRKRANLVHPDILENAALENSDGVDEHVSKKLQVDKLSRVSSALSATRHQEFVSAHTKAVKKLQDEAEKPKELNSSLVSKLKDYVERDSKSLVNLFTAYYLEGFKDCKAKGQILCPHAEWDKVQPDQLED